MDGGGRGMRDGGGLIMPGDMGNGRGQVIGALAVVLSRINDISFLLFEALFASLCAALVLTRHLRISAAWHLALLVTFGTWLHTVLWGAFEILSTI